MMNQARNRPSTSRIFSGTQNLRTGEHFMTRKTLSVAVALTVWLAAATCMATAQPKPKSGFVADVPFDFVVANRTLPAGRYEFQFVLGLPSATDDINVLAVRSLDGQHLYQ